MTARSGRRMHVDGYIDIWSPGHPMARADGYVAEHRIVAFDAGLLVDPTMHVHHRNGVKDDNRLVNLDVLTAEEHARRHAAEDGYIVNQYGVWTLRDAPRWPAKTERPCAGCTSTIPTSRRRDALYCTDSCRVRTFKRLRRNTTAHEVAA